MKACYDKILYILVDRFTKKLIFHNQTSMEVNGDFSLIWENYSLEAFRLLDFITHRGAINEVPKRGVNFIEEIIFYNSISRIKRRVDEVQ